MSSISVADTLPLDIVREIFKYFSHILSVNYPKDFPWFLGQICNAWRAVFHSMANEFWSSISIALASQRSQFTVHLQTIKDIVRFFLALHPEHPFGFYFLLSIPQGAAVGQAEYRVLFDTLIDNSHRWSDVDICCTDKLAVASLKRVKDRLPLLQSIGLDFTESVCHDEPGDDSLTLSFDILTNAPSLKDVYLQDMGQWELDWLALTSLRLTNIDDSSRFLMSLSQMENLEILEIDGSLFIPPNQHRTISLLRLQSLSLSGVTLLPSLSAPALEDLHIDLWREIHRLDYHMQDVIIHFLRRSSCSLLHLSLDAMGAPTAINVIRHTPYVTHLSLGFIDPLTDILEWLAPSIKREDVPLAYLQLLNIHYPGGPSCIDEEIEVLCSLLESRGSQLKDLRVRSLEELHLVDFCSRFSRRVIEAVCIGSGIKCSIFGPDYQ